MTLQELDGKEFNPNQVRDLILRFDMYETDEEDGLAVALTNQVTGWALPDCGMFVLNGEMNTYTFKLYK
jgi:hypothetical protein